MTKRVVMIEEGDIGVIYTDKVVDGEFEEFYSELVGDYVEEKSKDECINDFVGMVDEEFENYGEEYEGGDEFYNLVKTYVNKICGEGDEKNKWFVGSNGEYVVMVGYFYDGDDSENIEYDNEAI